MKIGTKSVLYGAHCFFLHTFFVARAWWHLFGFPRDPRLWIAFLVHDWGYWGKPNMDGEEGETHPELGGRIMEALFGKAWGDFTRFHSRSYARRQGAAHSLLCLADKLSLAFTPAWLYLPMVYLTGEVKEYKATTISKYQAVEVTTDEDRAWYAGMQNHMKRWVEKALHEIEEESVC